MGSGLVLGDLSLEHHSSWCRGGDDRCRRGFLIEGVHWDRLNPILCFSVSSMSASASASASASCLSLPLPFRLSWSE
jgi:hypothetical protein